MTMPVRLAYERLQAERGFEDGRDVWLSEAPGDAHELNSFALKAPRALKAVFPGSVGDWSHYQPPVAG